MSLLALLLFALADQARAQSDWDSAEDQTIDDRQAPPAASNPPPAAQTAPSVVVSSDPPAEVEVSEPSEDPTAHPAAPVGTLAIENGLWYGTYDNTLLIMDAFVWSPLARGWFQVTDDIRVSAAMAMAFAVHSKVTVALGATEDSGGALRLGSPAAAVEWTSQSGSLRYRIGAGLTVPIATAGDSTEAAALQLGAAIRGGWDIWLWAPDRLTVFCPGHLELDLSELFLLSFDAGVGLAFDMSDSDDDSELAVQAAGDIAYQISDTVGIGGRIMFVWTNLISISAPTARNRDTTQISAGAYGRFGVTDTLDATAAFVFNVDPPMGVSFRTGRVFGLHGGIELAFE